MKEKILSTFESRLKELETVTPEKTATTREKLTGLIGELRTSGSDRFDALRMGFESAWDELRATLSVEQDAPTDTVTADDRLSVLRMGLESAWDELRAGFSTAFESHDTSSNTTEGATPGTDATTKKRNAA